MFSLVAQYALKAYLDSQQQQILGLAKTKQDSKQFQRVMQQQRDLQKGVLPKKTKCNYLEKRTKLVAERLFRCRFEKTRSLQFLKNPKTQRKLELDLYNADYRPFPLAIECQGIQHYKYCPGKLHSCPDDFSNQKIRDHYKRQACRENNILLITVPYFSKKEDIESWLIVGYCQGLAALSSSSSSASSVSSSKASV
jgi:hypothetical protein